jgi:Domain of unknown function (DUF3291)
MAHLAQANIARRRAPLDSPEMGEFVAALDPVKWVGTDERPTVDEALARLRYLQAHGPSPRAFTLRRRFEPDGRPTRRRGRGA